MKKLIWKIRYARHMRRLSLMPWPFCWEAAAEALAGYPEALADDPRESCVEELSYWTD